MDIRPEHSLAQPPPRQKGDLASKSSSAESSGAARSSHSKGDSGRFAADPNHSSGLVDRLREMDVSDVHKLDRLQQAIADGSYDASPESFADSVLDALDQEA